MTRKGWYTVKQNNQPINQSTSELKTSENIKIQFSIQWHLSTIKSTKQLLKMTKQVKTMQLIRVMENHKKIE